MRQIEMRPSRKLSSKWDISDVGGVDNTKGISLPGCSYACIYCNQAGMDVGKHGEDNSPYITTTVDSGISVNSKVMRGTQTIKTIPLETLVTELNDFAYYKTDEPLILQNFTDPSLDWTGSFKLAEKLITDLNHKGPIIFITKGAISDKQLERAIQLKENGAKLVFIVTYSGLPKEIEPISAEIRINTIKKISKVGLPVIMSIRPLIQGINTSDESLRKILLDAGQYASAITSGGLYVFEFTKEAFAKAGIQLPKIYDDYKSTEFKIVAEDVQPRLKKIAGTLGILTPVYDHTTCATAYLREKFYDESLPDRIAHWAMTREIFSGCVGCDPRQMKRCKTIASTDTADLIPLAKLTAERIKADFEILPSSRTGTLLLKGGNLHLSELFILTEACGWKIENLPSEESLKTLSEQLFKNMRIIESIEDVELHYNEAETTWTINLPKIHLSDEQITYCTDQVWRATRSHFVQITCNIDCQ